MAKTTISIPDSMLAEINQRASEAGITRSGFVQEAAAHYIAALNEKQARVERQERIGKAIAGMREVAKHIPPGTDGTAIIRHFRDLPEPWLAPREKVEE